MDISEGITSASYSCVYRSQYLQTSTNISLYGGRGEGEVPYTAGGESPFILAKVVGIICSNEGPAQTAKGNAETGDGDANATTSSFA